MLLVPYRFPSNQLAGFPALWSVGPQPSATVAERRNLPHGRPIDPLPVCKRSPALDEKDGGDVRNDLK